MQNKQPKPACEECPQPNRDTIRHLDMMARPHWLCPTHGLDAIARSGYRIAQSQRLPRPANVGPGHVNA